MRIEILFAKFKTLLANVLRTILHRVLLIARVKVSRSCSIIIFSKDYFRQQNQFNCEQNPLKLPSRT